MVARLSERTTRDGKDAPIPFRRTFAVVDDFRDCRCITMWTMSCTERSEGVSSCACAQKVPCISDLEVDSLRLADGQRYDTQACLSLSEKGWCAQRRSTKRFSRKQQTAEPFSLTGRIDRLQQVDLVRFDLLRSLQ